jgi:hypothetical protein
MPRPEFLDRFEPIDKLGLGHNAPSIQSAKEVNAVRSLLLSVAFVTGGDDIPIRVIEPDNLRGNVIELAALVTQAAKAVEASAVLAREESFKKMPIGKEVERFDVHHRQWLGRDDGARQSRSEARRERGGLLENAPRFGPFA